MPSAFHAFSFPPALDLASNRFRTEADYATYVRSLMKQVLLTAPGERIDRPDFGVGLRRQLFEPGDETTATLMQTMVFQSLDRWLGDLIRVDEVRSRFEEGRLEVEIQYTLKARGGREVLNLEVTR